MIIARSLGLCCFANWAQMPPVQHNMLDMASGHPEQMSENTAMPLMADLSTPIIRGGNVLSVSFGEWQNLLSDFYLLASPHAQKFSPCARYIARVAPNDSLTRQNLFHQIDPPPRAS